MRCARCVAMKRVEALQSDSARFMALAIANYRWPRNATQRDAQP